MPGSWSMPIEHRSRSLGKSRALLVERSLGLHGVAAPFLLRRKSLFIRQKHCRYLFFPYMYTVHTMH